MNDVSLLDKRILVMLGSGGVGKTTTAAGVAVAAARRGQRVALISIDPAKRLADAMGLTLGSDLSEVAIPGLTGRLEAAMLDQKAVFDGMVARYASSDQARDAILHNRLYKTASEVLAGALEYMALAKVHELVEAQMYDLIVLDTPPDTHALDFLARPNVLAGFTENRVMSVMVKPFALAAKFGFGRVLGVGERLMMGVGRLAGVKALQEVAHFIVLLQDVIDGFQTAGAAVENELREPSTAFVLVAAASAASARSAAHLSSELARQGFRLDQIVLNRCLPSEVAAALSGASTEVEALRRRQALEEEVQDSLARHVHGLWGARPPLATIPEVTYELGDLEGLVRFANSLADGLESAAGGAGR